MSVREARVYTCTRVLYISYRVLSCTCLQNYTIGASLISVSGVRVGVGPVEFQLNTLSTSVLYDGGAKSRRVDVGAEYAVDHSEKKYLLDLLKT